VVINVLKRYKINKGILICLFVFFIISCFAINSASNILSNSYSNLISKQVMWYIIGFILIFFIMFIGNKFFIKHITILYIIGNILLLGLFFFGKEINFAKCWYVIPGIGNIQPSEFMKIILIIYLSKICKDFSELKNKTFKDELKVLFKVFIIVLIPSVLTFLEPDTGAVLMYLIITIFILFISGIRYRWFTILISILGILVGIILYLYFFKQNLFINILGTSFFLRVERLTNWSNGTGYQLKNSLIAIGNGGLLGTRNPLIYFPEPQTDFIFSTLVSSFGLVAGIITIILFIIFDILVIRCAIKSANKLNKMIISGIVGVLIYQQIQNIGMTIGILPITGITLPFISYGGSSLLSYMFLIAIVLNIHNESKYRLN